MKFAGFHEIRNERPTIAGNGKAYVFSSHFLFPFLGPLATTIGGKGEVSQDVTVRTIRITTLKQVKAWERATMAFRPLWEGSTEFQKNGPQKLTLFQFF